MPRLTFEQATSDFAGPPAAPTAADKPRQLISFAEATGVPEEATVKGFLTNPQSYKDMAAYAAGAGAQLSDMFTGLGKSLLGGTAYLLERGQGGRTPMQVVEPGRAAIPHTMEAGKDSAKRSMAAKETFPEELATPWAKVARTMGPEAEAAYNDNGIGWVMQRIGEFIEKGGSAAEKSWGVPAEDVVNAVDLFMGVAGARALKPQAQALVRDRLGQLRSDMKAAKKAEALPAEELAKLQERFPGKALDFEATQPLARTAAEPEAAAPSESQFGVFDRIKPGDVSGDFYAKAFAALQAGKTTVSGIKDPILQRHREAVKSGRIASPEDLKAAEEALTVRAAAADPLNPYKIPDETPSELSPDNSSVSPAKVATVAAATGLAAWALQDELTDEQLAAAGFGAAIVGSKKLAGLPESRLVEMLKEGGEAREAAAARIYTDNVPRLSRGLQKYVRQGVEVEDVIQRTMEKGLRAIEKGQFAGDAAIATYLYRIAENEVKSGMRYEKVRPKTESLDLEEAPGRGRDDAAIPSAHEQIADPNARSPEQLALDSALGQRMSEALDKLAPEFRTPFEMRELQGMDYAEIAAALDQPIGTVRSQISRAKEKLQRSLYEYRQGLGAAAAGGLVYGLSEDAEDALIAAGIIGVPGKGGDNVRSLFPEARQSPLETVNRLQKLIDNLGEEYTARGSSMTFEQYKEKVQPLRDELVQADYALKQWQESKPATSVEDVYPGYKEIPVGTRVIAVHGIKYKEPTAGVVTGRSPLRQGEKAWVLPEVDFGDGNPRAILPSDIKEVYGKPRAVKTGQEGSVTPDQLFTTAGAVGGALLGSQLDEDSLHGAVLGLLAGGLLGNSAGRKALAEVAKGPDKALGLVATRIGNIAPELKHALRGHAQRVSMATATVHEQVAPFLEALKKLPQGVQDEVARGLLNSDIKGVKAIPELAQTYPAVAKTLGAIETQLKSLGRFQEGVVDYFPRIVKDYEGLKAALGQRIAGDLEKHLFEAEAKMLKKENRGLTDVERSLAINRFLFPSPGSGTSVPGFALGRNVREVTAKLLPFYEKPADSLLRYLSGAIADIEKARFFGRDVRVKKKGSGQFTNVDDSIGAITGRLLEERKITPVQAQELQGMLDAYFVGGEKAMNPAFAAVRDLTNAGLLGQFAAAATQLGDVLAPIRHYGWIPTLQGLTAKIRGEAQVTPKELGLSNHIMEELGSRRTLPGLALDLGLKYSGFQALDRFGKDLSIRSALKEAQRQAKTAKGRVKLAEQWEAAYGPDLPRLLDDLEAGRVTDLTRTFAFEKLSDIQPISRAEMPELYLRYPNGRLLYQLKTYMLKQADIVRRESYNEIKSGKPQRMVRGLKNLATLATLYAFSNIPGDAIKDWLSGREVDVFSTPALVENVAQTFGFNRYAADKVVQGKVVDTAINMATPPVRVLEDIVFGKDKAASYIPLVGRQLYDIAGSGNEKREVAENILKNRGVPKGYGTPLSESAKEYTAAKRAEAKLKKAEEDERWHEKNPGATRNY